MAQPISLLILAGGASRRMGRDKATLPAGNETLVERLARRLGPAVDEVLVSAGNQSRQWPGLRTVVDRVVGLGPMGGMQAGFREARHRLVWVVACDLPDVLPVVGPYLATLMQDYDAAVPFVGGQPQPLCALYRPTSHTVIDRLLGQGERSVKALLDSIRVRYVEEDELRSVDPDLRSFLNLNTAADYKAWLRTAR